MRVLGTQDEPGDDRDDDEDVEESRNRKVWKSEPDAVSWFRAHGSPVDMHGIHRYIVDVSLECCGEPKMRTQRVKVHEAGEGGDPVGKIASIELEEPVLEIGRASCRERVSPYV